MHNRRTPISIRRLSPDFTLRDGQTHNKFSCRIEPALRVPSGSVIKAFTHEATAGQLKVDSASSALSEVDFDLVHTVDLPHMLVAMHMPKKIFVGSTQTAGEPGR